MFFQGTRLLLIEIKHEKERLLMKSLRQSPLRFLIWVSLIMSSAISLTGCSSEDSNSDFADAITTTPEQLAALDDYFSGKSEENANRAADVAASNMQTYLLVGILIVGILILIVSLLKKKK
jgi:cobalamin synthase